MAPLSQSGLLQVLAGLLQFSLVHNYLVSCNCLDPACYCLDLACHCFVLACYCLGLACHCFVLACYCLGLVLLFLHIKYLFRLAVLVILNIFRKYA